MRTDAERAAVIEEAKRLAALPIAPDYFKLRVQVLGLQIVLRDLLKLERANGG